MRNLFKTASLSIGIGAMVMLSTVPQAKADEWNKKTVITFSGPVEIPGKHIKGYATLPAGTYVFKLLDSSANRHIVQIFDKNEKKIYATILAVPNARTQVTGKTEFTFWERPAGEPEAIKAWFYPGDNFGQEFVYPKVRAKQIAQTAQAPVLYSSAETSPEVPEIQTPTTPEVSQMSQEDVGAYSPAGQEMELSQAVTPPPPANMQTPATTQSTATSTGTTTSTAPATQLPQTGSPLGLLMLGGMLAFVCAAGIRFARQS